MHGQLSTEIILLIAVMLLLLVPLMVYAYSRANIANEDLSVQKAEFAAKRIATLADSVGYLGGEAAIIDEIEVPSFVQSITINQHDIIFNMSSTAGVKQIVQTSSFALNSSGFDRIRKAGTYFIEIKALSNYNAMPGEPQVSLTLK